MKHMSSWLCAQFFWAIVAARCLPPEPKVRCGRSTEPQRQLAACWASGASRASLSCHPSARGPPDVRHARAAWAALTSGKGAERWMEPTNPAENLVMGTTETAAAPARSLASRSGPFPLAAPSGGTHWDRRAGARWSLDEAPHVPLPLKLCPDRRCRAVPLGSHGQLRPPVPNFPPTFPNSTAAEGPSINHSRNALPAAPDRCPRRQGRRRDEGRDLRRSSRAQRPPARAGGLASDSHLGNSLSFWVSWALCYDRAF